MAQPKTNVFLIGPMGSGKTAVGKHLARLVRAPFRDSDAEIESRTGVDISYIFSREGEDGFRQREREVIEMRFGLTGARPYTLEEVGRAFNVTRERIRQIENHTLKKLESLPEAQRLRDTG